MSVQVQTEKVYGGTDLLVLLEEAVHYNQYLEDSVLRVTQVGDRVLDFGAGIGSFARRIRAADRNVVCFEPDPNQRTMLKAMDFVCVDQVGAGDGMGFDSIYSLNVLEHIDDDVTALEALHAALRSGGRAYLYVPAMQILFSGLDQRVGHFRRYSKSELIDKLKKVGFQVSRVYYVDSLGFFASLAYKWFDHGAGDISRGSIRFYDGFIFPLSRLLDTFFSNWFGKNLAAEVYK